jgi:hypothetical protein
MRPRRCWFVSPPVLTLTLTLTLAAIVVLESGCEEPRNAGNGSATRTKKAPAEDPFIVGKTTQKIGRADDPALKKGAQVAPGKITARDPITIHGNAYVVSMDRIAMLNIEHTLDLYHAANDRWPANHEEFMKEVIQGYNISLPKLPHYQDYVYDEKQHKLLVYEYPERKATPPPGLQQP